MFILRYLKIFIKYYKADIQWLVGISIAAAALWLAFLQYLMSVDTESTPPEPTIKKNLPHFHHFSTDKEIPKKINNINPFPLDMKGERSIEKYGLQSYLEIRKKIETNLELLGEMVLISPSMEKQFFIGKYEVSIRQYKKYDSSFESDIRSLNYPVSNLSKVKIDSYINWLQRRTKLNIALPNVMQWRISAKGKSEKINWWKNKTIYGNINCLDCYASNEEGIVMEVSTLKPNSIGLHHILGNVSEWSADCIFSYGIPKCAIVGGSYNTLMSLINIDETIYEYTTYKSPQLGFRLVIN